jgi:flagella basal body P-ring formation protein FlgA
MTMTVSKRHTEPYRRRFATSMLAIAFILAAGLFETPGAVQQTAITTLESSEIKGARIYLGEIARIDGDDRQMIDALNEVVIGKAPLPSRTRVIDAQFIKLRLKQNGFNVATLVLSGPQKIRVTRSHVEIRKKEIQEMLADYLYDTALQNNPSARVKALQVPERIILPRGRITYRVTPPKNSRYVGQVPLSIEFSVDGNVQKKVRASATIEMMVDVVVAKNPLRKHKPLTEDDVELKKMDLAELPGDVVTDLQAVLGKRTRRSIGSNTVLRADLIELPPIINRGDVVVVIAESNGLRITTLAKAKRKGRLGERIPVENFDSKKIMHAQVVDSRTVKIEF